MRATVLGELSLVDDGAVLTGRQLPTRQTRVALAYLLLNRDRLVTRDEVVELLWRGVPPRAWEGDVRAVISKVRGALSRVGFDAAQLLPMTRGGVRLELPAGYWLDLDHARQLTADAVAALGRGEARRARQLAEEAVAMLRAGFVHADSSWWTDARQADVADLLARGLEAAAEAAVAAGDGPAALTLLEELSAADPLRESATRLAIAAHLAVGDRAGALRAYARCRSQLADELGVNPSPATEAAYLTALDVGTVTAQLPYPDVPGDTSTPFVGRSAELHALDRALERVGSRPHLVVLRGEPGIGKTRLAGEFGRRAHDAGATVLAGRCDEELVLPYRPFVEAIEHVARSSTPDVLAALVGTGGPDLARLVPRIAELLPDLQLRERHADDERARSRLGDAVRAMLERTARPRPLVLLLDDLHWADDASLRLLRNLLRAAGGLPVLAVATCRDTEMAPEHGLFRLCADLQADGAASVIDLAPLSHVDLAQLAGRNDTAVRLGELSGGNPLLALELLRDRRGDGGADLRASGAGIRQIVLRRTGGLSSATREAITVAAVIGNEFDVAVLADAARITIQAATDALDEAEAARLLQPVGAAGQRYRFSHAAMRDALVSSLTGARRAALHHHIAGALLARAELGAAVTVELAYHSSRSSDPTDVPLAIDACRRAGDEAREQLGYQEAALHYEQALTLLKDDYPHRPRRAELLVRLGEARLRAGRGLAREALLAGADLARACRQPDVLARAALAMADTWSFSGAVDHICLDLLREALAAIGNADTPGRSLLMGRLATELYYLGPTDDRPDRLAEQAIALAEQEGDPRALAAALHAHTYATWTPGRPARRLAAGNRIVLLASAGADPQLSLEGHAWRITALLELGDADGARRAVDDYGRAAAVLRQPRHRWYAQTRRVTLAALEGDDERALRLAEQARADGRRTGQADAENVYLAGIAPILIDRHDPHDLLKLVAHLGRTRRAVGPHNPSTRYVTALTAAAAAECGRQDQARALLDQLAGEDDGAHLLTATTLALQALAAAALNDHLAARRLIGQLAPLAGTHIVAAGGVAHWGAASHWLGVLALTLGRRDDAAAHLHQALDEHRRMGARRFEARTAAALDAILQHPRPEGHIVRAPRRPR